MVAIPNRTETVLHDVLLDWEEIGRLVHEQTLTAVTAHFESLARLSAHRPNRGDASGRDGEDES